MFQNAKAQLTAAEIQGLWSNYMADSMALVFIKQFLGHCKDRDIISVLKHAIKLSTSHLKFISQTFENEGIAIPRGYSDSDYNPEAPPLFTDSFLLFYIKNMTKTGLATYGAFLSGSSREDIRTYTTESLETTADLFNQTTDILLKRGLEIRCPLTPYPKENKLIKSTQFLAGWWGEQRPLTSGEVSNLFMNLTTQNNIATLMTGFSQVAQNEDVKHFLNKGKKIAKKHAETFSGFLKESDLQTPVRSDTGVTTSNTLTFSDRLIMAQIALLLESCIGDYGISLSLCHRRDLSLNYVKLTSEISTYGVDGAKILIKNEWMEQPPGAVDRDNLLL
ncbi:hypothetical protein JOD43_001916 [Pullulanibacillus pueri]|uniref:DUF3231 family protein n=1 Tax=Pullulanibacillus pueri TaxID=1437324 RepID=A0A8J3END1_9BACL|nr:DUF3231 family protein [Pullulanibacillus pueri]MBM7681744.1 hypothetical protein [Pullulanibacillus pueri]GGH84116.1 hypothetical protein GCM10007096_26450 [Pullulanibacillus pueri]